MHSVVLILLLGGDQENVNVGEDTTGGDGGVGQKSVELLIVADGELDVTGHNSGLLVVLGGVTGELEDLSGEVLKDGSEVHGGTSTDALGEAASLEEAGDSADGELKTSLAGSGNGTRSGGLALAATTFACTCHLLKFEVIDYKRDRSLFKGQLKVLASLVQSNRCNLGDIPCESDNLSTLLISQKYHFNI
jgi:hypothetical protein